MADEWALMMCIFLPITKILQIADSAYVSANSTGNGWISFYRNGKLYELFDNNKNLAMLVLGYEVNPKQA